MDAFVLSTTFMGTSRVNPLKTLYDIKSRTKKVSTNEVLNTWSDILFPPYRHEKAVKVFEAPAISCCTTGNLACFTFDSGCALTGAVSDFDIKSYDSARVYLWSILESPADSSLTKGESTMTASQPIEMMARPKLAPNKIIESITVSVEQARQDSIETALKNGVHIMACNYSSMERLVRSFGMLKDPTDSYIPDMKQADALQLGAAAASFDDSEVGYIAYGGGLGLIHLMVRP